MSSVIIFAGFVGHKWYSELILLIFMAYLSLIQDQKKLQEQIVPEQDAVFGTRPSPHRPSSVKKGLSVRSNNNTPVNVTPNRRLSMAGSYLNTDTSTKKAGITPVRSVKKEKIRPSAPVNYVAIGKEDLQASCYIYIYKIAYDIHHIHH